MKLSNGMLIGRIGTASAIALVALASGCGGAAKTVTVGSPSTSASTITIPNDPECQNGRDKLNGSPCTPAPGSTTAAAASTTNAGPPDCSSVDGHTFVGKCTGTNGVTLILANRGSTAHLKTLSAKVVNVDTTDSISNGSGFTANAHGKFVVVTIAVTNTTHSPQTFDEGSTTSQGQLQIGNNTYSVSFDAENTNDPNSFVTNNNDIQPGETRVGTIDFDVPPSAAAQVYKHGALLLVDFGESVDTAQTAAVLKLFQQ